MASVLRKGPGHILKSYGRTLILLVLLSFTLSCKPEVKELIITDTAEVKRAEMSKAAFDLQREETKRQVAQTSLRTTEVHERIAKARQMEEEAKLAREQIAREKKLAEEKKALAEEVAAIAAGTRTFNLFVADLRSRQGNLQLKLQSLPDEIEQSRTDIVCLTAALSSYRQGVVTNVRSVLNGKATVMDIQTIRKPDEYVTAIKNDKIISRVLARYNNDMFKFELDKVIEDLAYENKRLTTSWEMLRQGKGAYNAKLSEANLGTRTTTSELKGALDKVENRIKLLEQRLKFIQKGLQGPSVDEQLRQVRSELGQDRVYSTGVFMGGSSNGLYAERNRLRQMLELSSNTERQADASSSGITSNFALQEKGLRDEYEANIRRAFDNVERTVLHTVTERRESLEQALKSAQADLASIQLILDAHAKGQISRNDMLNLHSRFTNSVSESLSSAADHVLR